MNPVLVVKYHYWWQILTYMFVHADFSHILFNMLGLLFFGIQVERKIGSNEFLLFYLISGIGAGLFSLLVYWLSGSYLVFLMGASGAVFGVLLAFATLFPRAMIYIFGILPVRAPILVLGYTAIELFSQFFSVRSNVAHLTHLAGFGIAYLYLWIRLGLNPVRVFLEDRR
jgi:membrane associated rhomboid family serine protease